MVKFSRLELDKFGDYTEVFVRELPQSAIGKCPHHIFEADHYREDNTCKCDDPNAKEMAESGYTWRDGQWR